jgi:hypothetical protein
MRVVVLGKTPMCYCKRKRHDGEANDVQTQDPETGTVWAPGLRVTQEGEVIRMTISDEGIVTEKRITDEVPGYQYRDANLDVIWVTSVPKDDEAAVAYFHSIMLFGKGYKPVYVERRVEGTASKYQMLPFTFDPDTLTTTERS